MCLFCTIAAGVWETVTGRYFTIYLPWNKDLPSGPGAGAAVIACLIFFSYAIVLNTVVPISLYVSVEVIRFCHSLLINWDEKMYYPVTDTPAKARTTTLNEELGQIEYIFSDKTGTLTQNIMTFNKCTVSDRLYGDVIDEVTGEALEITEDMIPVDFSNNPYYEPDFKFYDPQLLDDVNQGKADVAEFFRLLAICHTVMCEEKDGILEYQAQSPDEAALTSAARNFGFVFRVRFIQIKLLSLINNLILPLQSRSPASITIEVNGRLEVYELLAILDFNNVRKRMSVIIRYEGKITLYCKGADSVIFERLSPGYDSLKSTTQEHLNKFAGEGLRTLCLAKKDLDVTVYEKWKERYQEAVTSLQNREEKVSAVYEEIEANLVLVGTTAIEDKLQDGVPQCIANLAAANIKLWVLTGDKQETAINIGYSCQLLTDDMVDIFTVEGWDYEDVEQELQRCREAINNHESHAKGATNCSVIFSHENVSGAVDSNEAPLSNSKAGTAKTGNNSNIENALGPNQTELCGGFALVVNGHSLVQALLPTMELLFLEVASRCKAVICCRVTPLQKALVVDLVKRHKNAVTLAIGDGANDVSMIKSKYN